MEHTQVSQPTSVRTQSCCCVLRVVVVVRLNARCAAFRCCTGGRSDVAAAAFASMLSVQWLTAGAVTTGSYCTYQGFLKQSADVSMAVWCVMGSILAPMCLTEPYRTVMIALHTFLVVFLRWSMRKRSLFVMLCTGWLLVLVIVIIGPAGYIANKGSFCECSMSSHFSQVLTTRDFRWHQRLLLLDFDYLWG